MRERKLQEQSKLGTICYRCNNTEKEYQSVKAAMEKEENNINNNNLIAMMNRTDTLLKLERGAIELFEESDKEYDDLENIWILLLQQEELIISKIKIWQTVNLFLTAKDPTTWSQLAAQEKLNFNRRVIEIRKMKVIEKIQQFLDGTRIAYHLADLAFSSQLKWWPFNKSNIFALKSKRMEQLQIRYDKLTNYLLQRSEIV
jgi:hypothetical protein